MHVARSEIMRKVDEDDIRYNQKYIEKQVSSLADGARGMHLGINNMTGKVLEFLVVDPRVEEVRTWEAWVTSMQYHCAFYQVSMAEPYSRVECSVGGRLWDLGSFAGSCRSHADGDFVISYVVEHILGFGIDWESRARVAHLLHARI